MTIKAIETRYKGYRFRSRLEARWAVFFDALGLEWRYEHQGYECGGERYLPDFEITDRDGDVYFVEVKGDREALVRDFRRFSTLLDFGGCLPNFPESRIHQKTGLLLLGDVPAPGVGAWFHPIIRHYKGLHRDWVTFAPSGLMEAGDGAVAGLFGLRPDECIEGSGEHWLVESRFIEAPRYFHKVMEAHEAARSARFEHGECPA